MLALMEQKQEVQFRLLKELTESEATEHLAQAVRPGPALGSGQR